MKIIPTTMRISKILNVLLYIIATITFVIAILATMLGDGNKGLLDL